jgi:sorbitol-specific phosphotransferase system component IIA
MRACPSRWLCSTTVLFAVLCLGACHDGYPEEDMVDGAAMSPAEHVVQLNEMGDEAARKVRQRISLIGDCLLRFTSARENVKPPSVDVPLLALDLSMSTHAGKQLITIAVPADSGGHPLSRTVFASPLWHDAVTFRSHLFQLQRLCAEAQAPA